jgi:outer membrane protein insertion porin family
MMAVRCQRWGIALVILVLASRGAKAQTDNRPATEPLEVVELTIDGNRAVPDRELRALLDTRSSPWAPWRDRAYFDQKTFDADLQRLTDLYRERGYPNARVEGTTNRRDDDEVALRIVVHEGEPVRADEVVFTGFDVLPVDQLNALKESAALKPGDVVAVSQVQELARQAVNALRNAGYAFPRVQALETRRAPDRVRIELDAEPGLQAVFGPIEIVGNVSVEDAVIRRQLAYLPGQRFQLAAIEESQRRLQRLELFDSVDIELVNQANPSGVTTRVIVTERDHTQFTYSFGFGSEERAYGDVEWRQANLLGGARTFSTRGRWSSLDRGVESAFVQPYLFRPNLTLSARGYAWQVDDRPYESLSRGGQAGVTSELGRSTFTVSYIHTLENVRIPESAEQDGLLSAVQASARRDATVQSGGTIRGYRIEGRVEQAGRWLPGAFNYVTLYGDIRHYQPVAGATLAGRVQYGSITPSGPTSDVPFSKRYFLGGAESLRGWGRFEVSPYSASLPIGGQSLFATSGEIRVPVAGPVGAVVFVDAGNVWENAWTLSLDVHASVGVGIRYRSRFGLLRLDFAHQLTTVEGLRVDGEPQNRRWRMHFGIGHAF